jgi:hypothetical protein
VDYEGKAFQGRWAEWRLNNLVDMKQWAATATDCLDIKDMGNKATIEADDLELEDAGSDSDSDSNSADGAEYLLVFVFDGKFCHMSL